MGASAKRASARCRWSCTPQPERWDCQPQNAAPSYSRPRAMRMAPRKGSERGDELLRLFLLGRGTFLRDLVQDLARTVLVADLEIRLGELELRADGFRVAGGFGIRGIEAQVREIEASARRRGRRLRGRPGGGHVEPRKIEVERGLLFLHGLRRNVDAAPRAESEIRRGRFLRAEVEVEAGRGSGSRSLRAAFEVEIHIR